MKLHNPIALSRAQKISLSISAILIFSGMSLMLIGFFQPPFFKSTFDWLGGPGGGGFDIVVFDADGKRHSLPPTCEPEESGLAAPLYAPGPSLINKYLIDQTGDFKNDPYLAESVANDTDYIPPEELKNDSIEIWPIIMKVDPLPEFIRAGESIEISAHLELGERFCDGPNDIEAETLEKRRANYIAWKPSLPLDVTYNIDAPNFNYEDDSSEGLTGLGLLERTVDYSWILSPKEISPGNQKIQISAEPKVGISSDAEDIYHNRQPLNRRPLKSIIELEVRDPTGISPEVKVWAGYITMLLGVLNAVYLFRKNVLDFFGKFQKTRESK